SPIEFKDASVFYEFEKVRFYGIPALTLMLLVSMIHANDAISAIVFKVVGSILITGCVLYVMVMSLCAGTCQWTDRETGCSHDHDARKPISVRALGCGAWDSGPAASQTALVRDRGPWFRAVTASDTTSIDPSAWVRPGNID